MYCETFSTCPRNMNTSKDGAKHAEKCRVKYCLYPYLIKSCISDGSYLLKCDRGRHKTEIIFHL